MATKTSFLSEVSTDMARIGIAGSGTWGTALAIHLSKMGHEVRLWSALKDEIEEIGRKREHRNLPGVDIPEGISCISDDQELCADADVVILSVPSIYTRSTAARLRPCIAKDQIVLCVAKGIEEDSLKTQTDICQEELPQARVCVLSGPSHAEEVSRGLPTAVVVGASDKTTAEYVQNLFMSPAFRVYTSSDMKGMEVGGSLKNVIALAAGMSDGLGYGDNTMAALITRGIAEMSRLGKAMDCDPQTFFGLTGLGDLIVTCSSRHSRNRRAGVLIGKGMGVKEAMDEVHMVVEGVYSAKAGLQLARKYGVSMPIVEEVNSILFEGKSASDAVRDLMCREKRVEHAEIKWE